MHRDTVIVPTYIDGFIMPMETLLCFKFQLICARSDALVCLSGARICELQKQASLAAGNIHHPGKHE